MNYTFYLIVVTYHKCDLEVYRLVYGISAASPPSLTQSESHLLWLIFSATRRNGSPLGCRYTSVPLVDEIEPPHGAHHLRPHHLRPRRFFLTDANSWVRSLGSGIVPPPVGLVVIVGTVAEKNTSPTHRSSIYTYIYIYV